MLPQEKTHYRLLNMFSIIQNMKWLTSEVLPDTYL